MRITFKNRPEHTGWAALEDMWREAERIEHFDGGWLYDHFYPIYGERTGPCFEGWTALSFLAGITSRLRLGLMVTGVPYRNPGLLANMVTTFDHFSRGRLDLGLGMGWFEDEAKAYGMPLLPLGKRLSQFEEACGVLTRLFTEPSVTHEGEYYTFVDAHMEPKPVQKPHPPIMIGGVGEKRMLRIVARYARDWNYPGGTPEDFRHKAGVLHSHCASIGRDPSEITLSCHIFVQPDVNATADNAAAFAEAGAGHLCLYFDSNDDPSVIGRTADAVVAALPQPQGR